MTILVGSGLVGNAGSVVVAAGVAVGAKSSGGHVLVSSGNGSAATGGSGGRVLIASGFGGGASGGNIDLVVGGGAGTVDGGRVCTPEKTQVCLIVFRGRNLTCLQLPTPFGESSSKAS